MNAKILSIVAALAVCGCATSYQQTGFTGGFSETKLGPDTVRVVFKGNGYTSDERATDFALLRAAQLCREGGFTHFTVQPQASSTPAVSVNGGMAKPGVALLAKFYRSKVDELALDAAFVVSSIKSKYNLQ